MYVWELIAHRLRGEGWTARHRATDGSGEAVYVVELRRPGQTWQSSGPTLTEAYAAAARRARGAQATAAPRRPGAVATTAARS